MKSKKPLSLLPPAAARRAALQKGLSALAGTSALAAAPYVRAQAPAVKWRLTSAFGKNLDILFGAAESLSRQVAQMTGGKFVISVHAQGEVTTMPQIVEAVQAGTVECGHTYPTYYFGKDETFALDGGVPFGLNSRQATAWMTEGNGMKLLRDFYRTYNIVNFPLGNTGAQMAGWFRKEVRTVADLSGLRIRIGGFPSRIAMRLGMLPQNIAITEAATALEKQQLDACEWYGPYDDQKLGLYRQAPNYYYPAWWEGGAQMSLYVNLAAWNALPTEYKAILENAAARVHSDVQAKYDAKNPAALKSLIANGARLNRFSPEVMNAAFKASQEYYAELNTNNLIWKRLFEDWSKFRGDQYAWLRVAEGAFDQYMQAQRL